MNIENLPREILHKIVSNLTFWERRNLKKCTKTMRSAAITAQMVFSDTVKFSEIAHFTENRVESFIQLCFDDICMEFLKLIGTPAATCVKVYRNGVIVKKLTVEQQRFSDVAKKYLRDIVFKENVICECCDTNYIFDEDEGDLLNDFEKLNTRKFRFFEPAELEHLDDIRLKSSVALWLNHVNPRYLRDLVVYKADFDCSLTDSASIFQVLDRLIILRRSDISDAVLRDLKALDVELDPANVTVDGINQIIKKWTAQKVPRGSRFVYYCDETKDFSIDVLTRNIKDVSVITNTKSVIPITSNRHLLIWVDSSSVNIECMKTKA